MATSKVTYLGDLRTTCEHLKSGNTMITDAPTDNNGKGEAFSPTDTVATALASCMITIMGIRANKNGWSIDGTEAMITKVMASHPRRISEIHITMTVPGVADNRNAQQVLKDAAINCPVAKSISPDIEQNVEFVFS